MRDTLDLRLPSPSRHSWDDHFEGFAATIDPGMYSEKIFEMLESAIKWNRIFEGTSTLRIKFLSDCLWMWEQENRALRQTLEASFTKPFSSGDMATTSRGSTSYADVLEAIENAQSFRYESPTLLQYIVWQVKAAVIVFEIRKIISILKARLTRRYRAVFCGITWHKRVWFLLHGSHPPKIDAASAVGSLECGVINYATLPKFLVTDLGRNACSLINILRSKQPENLSEYT